MIGRATRAYVSGYDRSRVHQSSLYRFERRPFFANFNGAMPVDRLIQCVTWRTDAPEVGVLSDLQISEDRREASVMFACQLGGWANMRCEATLDNGEKINQVFRVNVREASYFFNETPIQPGPFSLTTCLDPPPNFTFLAGPGVGDTASWRGYSAGEPFTPVAFGSVTGGSVSYGGATIYAVVSADFGETVVAALGVGSAPAETLFASISVIVNESATLILDRGAGNYLGSFVDGNLRTWLWDGVAALVTNDSAGIYIDAVLG